jgi:hypothetical protein
MSKPNAALRSDTTGRKRAPRVAAQSHLAAPTALPSLRSQALSPPFSERGNEPGEPAKDRVNGARREARGQVRIEAGADGAHGAHGEAALAPEENAAGASGTQKEKGGRGEKGEKRDRGEKGLTRQAQAAAQAMPARRRPNGAAHAPRPALARAGGHQGWPWSPPQGEGLASGGGSAAPWASPWPGQAWGESWPQPDGLTPAWPVWTQALAWAQSLTRPWAMLNHWGQPEGGAWPAAGGPMATWPWTMAELAFEGLQGSAAVQEHCADQAAEVLSAFRQRCEQSTPEQWPALQGQWLATWPGAAWALAQQWALQTAQAQSEVWGQAGQAWAERAVAA